jgi:hypothetical protein
MQMQGSWRTEQWFVVGTRHTNRIKKHVSAEPCMLAVSQTMAGSDCNEQDREVQVSVAPTGYKTDVMCRLTRHSPHCLFFFFFFQ